LQKRKQSNERDLIHSENGERTVKVKKTNIQIKEIIGVVWNVT